MSIKKQTMNVVFVGHVDHGKSTVIGRLLADTNSLPIGKLEKVKENCQRTSKPFEYAFLIDALKDEQAQGITIDTARVFFKTKKRDYIVIDAPGHIEFLKNMVTGASRAQAALLVIDAYEGIQENSKRHGYMLSLLGIKQMTVLVNKMDLVDYNKEVFEKIVSNYSDFLASIDIKASSFIPVSGVKGDMVAKRCKNLDWYDGPTVLQVLDQFSHEQDLAKKPFRLPVQDVYKFTKFGDSRRIIAGTIESGSINVGDQIVFYPSGKVSIVKSIERFNAPDLKQDCAGSATGLTLDEQIYIRRGEIAVRTDQERPQVSSRIKTSLFWLGKNHMIKGKEYRIKIGTTNVTVTLESIERIIDASDLKTLADQNEVRRHDVAECVLKLNRAVCFDIIDTLAATSRFVIVDEYEIRGGGIILEALEDKQHILRDKIFLRNYKWIKSNISLEQREQRYGQKPAAVFITGTKESPRKNIARALEEKLFSHGRAVYFLGIGSIIYGIDSDIKSGTSLEEEHLRRLAEVANIMLDSGMILIVSAAELSNDDLTMIQTTIDYDSIEVVWVGDKETTDIKYDLKVTSGEPVVKAVNRIESLLQDNGYIFTIE